MTSHHSSKRRGSCRILLLLLVSLLYTSTSAFVVLSPSHHNNVARSTCSAPSSSSSSALWGKKAARNKGNTPANRRNSNDRSARKPKDDVIEIEAVVQESLPNAMFRCVMDNDENTTTEPILATISGKIRKNFVKILVGDRVLIELSPYDLTRGRITFRYR